jgi:hypothetical protein
MRNEQNPTQVFVNQNFKKRDYECTNIVACVAEKAPDENYVPTDKPQALQGLTRLWIQGGVEYYGYL